jgi:hypothetical protein
MGKLTKDGEEIYGTFNKGFLEGKGMILNDEVSRVGEFKKGVRDGFCTSYLNDEISFEGMCKIIPDGFGKIFL